jgi:hypothetical protein
MSSPDVIETNHELHLTNPMEEASGGTDLVKIQGHNKMYLETDPLGL